MGFLDSNGAKLTAAAVALGLMCLAFVPRNTMPLPSSSGAQQPGTRVDDIPVQPAEATEQQDSAAIIPLQRSAPPDYRMPALDRGTSPACQLERCMDWGFGAAIAGVLDPETRLTILELGAGCGRYAFTSFYKYLGFDITSFSQVANIADLTNGLVQHADLTKPQLQTFKPARWVIALEAAEFMVKPETLAVFLRNIADNALEGAIISWPSGGPEAQTDRSQQKNADDSPERTNVITKMQALGFVHDADTSKKLYKSVAWAEGCCQWVRRSVVVFHRKNLKAGAAKRKSPAQGEPQAIGCRPVFGGRKKPDYISGVTGSGGYKMSTCHRAHYLDWGLVSMFAHFLHPAKGTSIIELGAGCGCYANFLNYVGFDIKAFDGTPDVAKLTNGIVNEADFVKPMDLQPATWVMSMEVGEHIPKAFEAKFLKNIVDHAREGVILSWAIPGQGGEHHVNELSNDALQAKMEALDFVHDVRMTKLFRKAVGMAAGCCSWLKRTITVYRRKGHEDDRCRLGAA